MNNPKQRGRFESLLLPQFDEGSLFTMSYLCILLFAVNSSPTEWNLNDLRFNEDSLKGILILIPFLSGMFLCIYHAFSDRRKTNLEKKLMMIFAAFINGFAGIWAGTYLLVHEIYSWYGIFPIWNIITGYILLASIRTTDIEEDIISDENIGLGQLLITTLFTTVLFVMCFHVWNINWAATFSICIAAVGSLNTFMDSVFPVAQTE